MKNRQTKKITNARQRRSQGGAANPAAPSRAPSVLGVVPVPRNFPRHGDAFPLRLRSSFNIANSYSFTGPSVIIALTPTTINTQWYGGLANIMTVLAGLGQAYSRFCVTRIRVEVTPTTPTTGGGYIAVGYEADDSNTSSPPTSLNDVATSTHSAIASVGETAVINVNPTDYFNAWVPCTATSGASTIVSQMGVVQIYGSNAASTSTAGPPIVYSTVGIGMMEVDIWFAGYRALS